MIPAQPRTHTVIFLLAKSRKAQTFCVIPDYTNTACFMFCVESLATHTDPRHVNLRACTWLLPVVYLHVLRTCVLLTRWTCTAQSSCTVPVYCVWPRCAIKGAPKVGFWALEGARARSRASYQMVWSHCFGPV